MAFFFTKTKIMSYINSFRTTSFLIRSTVVHPFTVLNILFLSLDLFSRRPCFTTKYINTGTAIVLSYKPLNLLRRIFESVNDDGVYSSYFIYQSSISTNFNTPKFQTKFSLDSRIQHTAHETLLIWFALNSETKNR